MGAFQVGDVISLERVPTWAQGRWRVRRVERDRTEVGDDYPGGRVVSLLPVTDAGEPDPSRRPVEIWRRA